MIDRALSARAVNYRGGRCDIQRAQGSVIKKKKKKKEEEKRA